MSGGPQQPGRRQPGRPVSQASRQAALDAAAAALEEAGLAGFSVNEVSRRSGVSKATIYNHWSNGLELAVEAWGGRMTVELDQAPGGDAVADLLSMVERYAAIYASARGTVIAQLIGASLAVPGGPDLLRDRFFAPRRAQAVRVIRHGIVLGQLRADLDPDLAVDVLFGAMVFRRFNGRGPLAPAEARTVAAVVLKGMRP